MSGSSAFTLGKVRKALRAALPETVIIHEFVWIREGEPYRLVTPTELRLIETIRSVVDPGRRPMVAKMAASPGDPPVPGSHSNVDNGRGGRI